MTPDRFSASLTLMKHNAGELTLISIPNPTTFNNRLYFKDSYKNIYCMTDNGWFFCSKDGEPQNSVNFVIRGQSDISIQVTEE